MRKLKSQALATLLTILLGAGVFAGATPAHAASVGEGKACTPVGKTAVASGVTFKCVKQGSKKVWTATVADVTFKMPNLKGQILQSAQNKLQGLGSFLLDQEDAKGLGRMQILDRKWKVCRQEPAAGKKVSISEFVTLWSVKTSESC